LVLPGRSFTEIVTENPLDQRATLPSTLRAVWEQRSHCRNLREATAATTAAKRAAAVVIAVWLFEFSPELGQPTIVLNVPNWWGNSVAIALLSIHSPLLLAALKQQQRGGG